MWLLALGLAALRVARLLAPAVVGLRDVGSLLLRQPVRRIVLIVAGLSAGGLTIVLRFILPTTGSTGQTAIGRRRTATRGRRGSWTLGLLLVCPQDAVILLGGHAPLDTGDAAGIVLEVDRLAGTMLVPLLKDLLDAQVGGFVPRFQLLLRGIGEERLATGGMIQQVVEHLVQQDVPVLLGAPLRQPVGVDVESAAIVHGHGGDALIEHRGDAFQIATRVRHEVLRNVLCFADVDDMLGQLDHLKPFVLVKRKHQGQRQPSACP